jgi:hypothetical protein
VQPQPERLAVVRGAPEALVQIGEELVVDLPRRTRA